MKLMFVGDINLGEYYTGFGCGPGTYAKSKDNFEKVAHIFNDADLVAGNLEASICSLGLKTQEPESAVLRAHPETVKILTKHNFKILQVANNHTVQHGEAAFRECIGILDDNNILYAGINNSDPTIYKHGNRTIGFLAASDVPDNTDKMQQQYQRLDERFINLVSQSVEKVDHLILMLHWGLEESTTPLPYQRELAKKFKGMGVRAIIGSHPHLFYEIETTPNFLCAYSLGNFLFDLCWDRRLLKSGILEINITDTGLESKVWPIRLTKNGALPIPTNKAIPIKDKIILYELGADIKHQQIKKLLHFVLHIFQGNVKLKSIFLKRKFFN